MKPKEENKRQNEAQDQKTKDQEKQEKDKGGQEKQERGSQHGQPQGSPPPSGGPDSSQEPRQRQQPSGQPKGQSAFGDMQKPPATPSKGEPEGPMQKVGGIKKDEANDPARANPELAVPLEKLEQLTERGLPGGAFRAASPRGAHAPRHEHGKELVKPMKCSPLSALLAAAALAAAPRLPAQSVHWDPAAGRSRSARSPSCSLSLKDARPRTRRSPLSSTGCGSIIRDSRPTCRSSTGPSRGA